MGIRQPFNPDGTLVCRVCKESKPADLKNFKPCTNTKSGITATCRDCQNEYAKKWKEKNRDRLAETRRVQYKERYGEISRANERARQEKKPWQCRAQRLREGMSIRSKQLNLDFDKDILTNKYLINWFKSTPYCPCCGVKIDYGYKHDNKKHNDCPSIDRIDNKKGYVIGNVALICWRCNNLKRDATADELQKIVDWLRSLP